MDQVTLRFIRDRRRREALADLRYRVGMAEADIRIDQRMFGGESVDRLRKRLRRLREELAVATAADKGRAIHERHQNQTADVGRRLRESQDERYPDDYRAKQREELTKEYRALDNWAEGEMKAWYQQQMAEAQRVYESPPDGDAAAETRALREEMQIGELAQRYSGRVMARNHLVPEAKRLLLLGVVDRARVYSEAARRAGAEDALLDREVNAALDRALPHRQQAIKQRLAVITTYEQFRIDQVKGRVLNGIGSAQERVRDASYTEFAEWKQKREDQLLRESGVMADSDV